MGVRGYVDRNATSEVTASANITDNSIVRGDGGAKGIQGSIGSIDDTGNTTFTCTADGSSNALIYRNDNDTANSGVNFQLRSGGASASDPYMRFAISGVREYSFGIDNDDDDSLKMTNANTLGGGSTFWKMTTAGERTMPLQPAFLAFLGTTDSDVTGNNTTYTFGSGNALTEIFDQNSDFVTTGTFTAPVTGRYRLGFMIRTAESTSASTSVYSIVTSNRTYSRNESISSLATHTHYLECFCDMDATDTATFTVTLNGIGADTADVSGGNLSFCWGNLVC